MTNLSAPATARQHDGNDTALRQRLSSKTALTMDSVKRLLADIWNPAPEITARAPEIETARRVPLDLVEKLRAASVFRLFVPRSQGGLELDLPAGLEVVKALSRIEGSVGWTAMIGNGGALFAPLLPRETYKQVYRDGPDVIVAGSIQPVGTAERVTGGWRVNGRWPFASGCLHADWIAGFCVMTEGGKPIRNGGGAPLIKGFFMPARDWQIEDTWYAVGLKGTGSHHIAFRDKMVPEMHFLEFEGGVPCLPGPLYQAVPQFLPLLHAANSVGTAKGALDQLVAHANTGRQQLKAAAPMRESEIFQYELGRIAADLRAAEAYHQAQVATHWRHALAGTLNNEALHAQATQAGVWLATACVRAADACFTLAGGSAVYASPLQRRMRDLHTAAQHATVHQRHYVNAGKSLLNPASA